MDLTALKLFCDLVETGSFSRTAERYELSQSAVSQRLRTLELEYGQTFIERSQGRSKIEVTEAGRVLYEGAKSLVEKAKQLDTLVRSLSDEAAGTIRVAAVYSLGLHAIPPRLKPFLTEYPKVNVHIEYCQGGRVITDVLTGAADVGVVAVPTPRAGIEIVPFGSEKMCVVCSPEHKLARQTEVSLKDLQGEPFIAFEGDIPTRKLIDSKLSERKVSVNIVQAIDNIETIKNLVEIGTGITILPAGTALQQQLEGTLAVIPFTEADRFVRPAGLILKKSGPRRAVVRKFVEEMRRDNNMG